MFPSLCSCQGHVIAWFEGDSNSSASPANLAIVGGDDRDQPVTSPCRQVLSSELHYTGPTTVVGPPGLNQGPSAPGARSDQLSYGPSWATRPAYLYVPDACRPSAQHLPRCAPITDLRLAGRYAPTTTRNPRSVGAARAIADN